MACQSGVKGWPVTSKPIRAGKRVEEIVTPLPSGCGGSSRSLLEVVSSCTLINHGLPSMTDTSTSATSAHLMIRCLAKLMVVAIHCEGSNRNWQNPCYTQFFSGGG